MSEVRDVLHAEDKDTTDAARDLVLANAEDEKMLSQLSDDYADRILDRLTYLKQSQRLRKRIEDRESTLATIRGGTALSHIGGEVRALWPEMSAEDKRSIILSILECIEVGPVVKFGSNRFDPDRLTFVWRKRVDIESVNVAFMMLRARMAEGRRRYDRQRGPDCIPPGGFDGFLEDLPPSPYDGIDPETDLGLTIPGA